jgi:hypothetical protein
MLFVSSMFCLLSFERCHGLIERENIATLRSGHASAYLGNLWDLYGLIGAVGA